jgi:hypothetical protein
MDKTMSSQLIQRVQTGTGIFEFKALHRISHLFLL